jgi:hypothetical protein
MARILLDAGHFVIFVMLLTAAAFMMDSLYRMRRQT